MSERKRSRLQHSELSQEERDRINARRRALAAEKKQQTEALVPVYIQHDNIHASFVHPNLFAESSAPIKLCPKAESNNSVSTEPKQRDSLEQESNNTCDEFSKLYEVPIGIAADFLVPTQKQYNCAIPTEPYKLPQQPSCTYCGAKKFPYETLYFCCYKGQVDLYSVTIPDEFQQLYSGETAESIHFLKYVKPYNDAFAFTSFGVHLDPQFAKRVNGIYTFRAQGQIYHYVNGLLPSGKVPSIFQIYFYDTEHEVDHRKGSKDKLQTSMIEALILMLNRNPYSRFFRSLARVPDLQNCQIKLMANPKLQNSATAPPNVSQVAAIWNEDEDNDELAEREIIVRNHDGHSHKIQYYYGCYDPLQYPLLFPRGEPGWHQRIKKKKSSNTSRHEPSQPVVLPTHASTAEELIATEAAVRQATDDDDSMVSAREFYAYRLKFNVEVTDQTGSIPATVFAEKAEQLYNITAAEMINNTTEGNLSIQMIQKLSTPKEYLLILKASMYTYGAISQCVFNVHSVYDAIPDRQAPEQASSQNLGPNTPKKRGTNALSIVESPTNEDPMEQDSPVQPFKSKQKKE